MTLGVAFYIPTDTGFYVIDKETLNLYKKQNKVTVLQG
jgi:hypothetical protein